jgi:hypothetical protein
MSTIPFANPSLAAGFNLSQASRFGTLVRGSLVRQGYPAATAASFSLVYQSAYGWVLANWSLVQPWYSKAQDAKSWYDAAGGATTWNLAGKLEQNAQMMGASSKIITGFSDVRLVGGAAVLSPLVDVMQKVAKHNGVDLNPCALSIAKVALDLAGIAGGGLTAESGFGVVLAVMSTAATVGDLTELGGTCGPQH